MQFEHAKISSPEFATVVKRIKRDHKIKLPKGVYFSYDNNYTICTVLPGRGRVPRAIGVSKRNMVDNMDRSIGRIISLKRALLKLTEEE